LAGSGAPPPEENPTERKYNFLPQAAITWPSLLAGYLRQSAHGAIAAAHLNDNEELVKRVKADFQHADISAKLKTLLVIASKVQKGGKHVTAEDVEEARAQGATDVEIHDTVLIAAAFCMYNRYVDGLATWQPREEELYRQRGKKTAREGYVAVSREYIPQNAHGAHSE